MSQKRPPCIGCLSDEQPVDCGVASVNAFMSAAMLFALDVSQVTIYIGSLCDKHARVAARVITFMAEKNGTPADDLLAKLAATYGDLTIKAQTP